MARRKNISDVENTIAKLKKQLAAEEKAKEALIQNIYCDIGKYVFEQIKKINQDITIEDVLEELKENDKIRIEYKKQNMENVQDNHPNSNHT